jgi:hypothetical protein
MTWARIVEMGFRSPPLQPKPPERSSAGPCPRKGSKKKSSEKEEEKIK